jgi:predicted O-methyltransferase YrrM
MKDYKFTNIWFSEDEMKKIIATVDTAKELHLLEIGSYEGYSAIWFLDNVLKHKDSSILCLDMWKDYTQDKDSANSYGTESAHEKNMNGIFENFKYNTKSFKNLISIKNSSSYVLPALIYRHDEYDIIYIDGNHTAPFVISDAVMSWHLLKVGGIMIFDDYLWQAGAPDQLKPMTAIDNFINLFSDYLEIIHSGYIKAIRRIK